MSPQNISMTLVLEISFYDSYIVMIKKSFGVTVIGDAQWKKK
jgi:hypothetical protein